MKTPGSAKQSTATLRITLTGNRAVLVSYSSLDERARKDVIGICVTNSQAPERLLANLNRVPGVLSSSFE
jgi:hypothetical protein